MGWIEIFQRLLRRRAFARFAMPYRVLALRSNKVGRCPASLLGSDRPVAATTANAQPRRDRWHEVCVPADLVLTPLRATGTEQRIPNHCVSVARLRPFSRPTRAHHPPRPVSCGAPPAAGAIRPTAAGGGPSHFTTPCAAPTGLGRRQGVVHNTKTNPRDSLGEGVRT